MSALDDLDRRADLRARAEAAEQEVLALRTIVSSETGLRVMAEVRAEAAEKDRDEWRGRAESKWLQTDKYAARIRELEEALLRILRNLDGDDGDGADLIDLMASARSLLKRGNDAA